MKKSSILLILVLFSMLLGRSLTAVWSTPPLMFQPPSPLAASAASGPYKWDVEEVDVPKNFNYFNDRALRVDENGHSHLVYGGDHLYYAYSDGASWAIQTVDGAPTVGSSASLVLDGAGRPHIAYVDDHNEQVRYAVWTGAEWHIENVAPTFPGAPNSGTAIALDGAGVPGIAYFGEVIGEEWQHSLYFARPSGGDWNTSLVRDGVGLWLLGPSAEFDQAGRPRIAFAEHPMMPDGINKIRLAEWTGSAWSLETVHSVSSNSASLSIPSLVLDSLDRPHLAFAASGLYYAYWTGNQWDIDHVLPGDLYGGYGTLASLALDSSTQPHIAMGGTYVTRNNELWSSQTPSGMYRSSIALDLDDRPCISGPTYDGLLNFMHREGDAWPADTVDEHGGWISESGLSFALDAFQVAHLNYSDDLRYTTQISDSWHIEKLSPPAGGWSVDNGLEIDSQGRPYIAYRTWTLAYQDTVGLAQWTGDEWLYQAVDAASPDDPIILRLDSQDRPHLGYICPETTDICYAYWNGGEWVKEVVDSHGFGFVSLALDSQDRPHFVYQDYEITSPTTWEYHLRYTVWDGDAWQTETVSSGSWDRYISLALDANDVPHLLFWSDVTGTGTSLKYATYQGDAWRIETVYDGPGSRVAFRLDNQGEPHVAFLASPYLHYAHRGGSGWQVRPLGKIKAVNVALDHNDWPHIAYIGENAGGLYLLRPTPLSEKVYLPTINR